MKVASIIFSYKDPVRVLRCYGELLRVRQTAAKHTIIILDNSPSALCPQTPDTVWLGDKNLGHGGMIDHVLRIVVDGILLGSDHFDFIGMLNCDTWGYQSNFLERMLPAMRASRAGMISPAIAAGSAWPCMAPQAKGPQDSPVRCSNFVETIAPYYSHRLLATMSKLSPFEQYGYVDRTLSVFSIRCGFRNYVVDNTAIYHDAGAGMAPPARDDLQTNWQKSLQAWLEKHPDLQDTYDMWPDEINALGV